MSRRYYAVSDSPDKVKEIEAVYLESVMVQISDKVVLVWLVIVIFGGLLPVRWSTILGI